jgi:hypothetical protein
VGKLAVRIVLLAALLIRHGSFITLSEVAVLLNRYLFFTGYFAVTITKVKPFLFFATHAQYGQM